MEMHDWLEHVLRRTRVVKAFNFKGDMFMVKRVFRCVTSLHNDEAGQGLVEYALIMGLVCLAAVSTMSGLATEINAAFSSVTSRLASALGT
jgi:Flp pilus assembly pilin Flp